MPALVSRPPLLTRGTVEIFRHDWPLDSRSSIDDARIPHHTAGTGRPAPPRTRDMTSPGDDERAPEPASAGQFPTKGGWRPSGEGASHVPGPPDLTGAGNPRLSNRMPQTDIATVALARDGDSDAFRTLVERHSRAVYRLAHRMTGNPSDAEDVVQETFLKAYKQLGRFESRANFSTWLHRIAVNCSIDLIRSRPHREAGHDSADLEEMGGEDAGNESRQRTPERLMLSTEVQERINTAMSALSRRERAAFVLRHFEGQLDRGHQPIARAQDERDQAQHLPRGEENASRTRTVRRHGRRSHRIEHGRGQHGQHGYRQGHEHPSDRRRARSSLLRRDDGERRDARGDAPDLVRGLPREPAAAAARARGRRRERARRARVAGALRAHRLGAPRTGSAPQRAAGGSRGSCCRPAASPGSRASSCSSAPRSWPAGCSRDRRMERPSPPTISASRFSWSISATISTGRR